MSRFRVGRIFYLLVSVAALILDRLTKWQVQRRIDLHDSISVVPGFFRIAHLENWRGPDTSAGTDYVVHLR